MENLQLLLKLLVHIFDLVKLEAYLVIFLKVIVFNMHVQAYVYFEL